MPFIACPHLPLSIRTAVSLGALAAALACNAWEPSGAARGQEVALRAPQANRTAGGVLIRVGEALSLSDRAGPVALVDLNGDERLDLVVTEHGYPPRVFVGNGEGSFEEQSSQGAVSLTHPSDIAAGDQNRDGHLDLIIADHESHAFHVLLGNGDGTLRPAAMSPVEIVAAPHIHTLSVGDIDQDDWLDVVTDSWQNARVYFHRGNADGFSVDREGVDVAPQPRNNVRLVDLNGDGALDFAAPGSSSSTVTVLLGDGNGNFAAAPGSPHPVTPSPFFVVFPDLNADGHLDILVAHRAGNWTEDQFDGLSLLRGDGQGGFRLDSSLDAEVGGAPSVIATCDLDGDGIDDAAVANAFSRDITIVLGDEHDIRSLSPAIPVSGHPMSIACGDVDGDAKGELAVAIDDPSQVLLLAPL